MKKTIFKSAVLAVAAFMTFATVSAKNEKSESENQVAYMVTTDGNGEIASAVPMPTEMTQANAWRIRDLSGATNIRSSPGGKVCMKLKAWTDYVIYSKGSRNGWLSIASIYNETQDYWVRLHSSKTGTYWISASILY